MTETRDLALARRVLGRALARPPADVRVGLAALERRAACFGFVPQAGTADERMDAIWGFLASLPGCPPPAPEREARRASSRAFHQLCVQTLAEIRRQDPRLWARVLRMTRAEWRRELGAEEAERSIADLLRNVDAFDVEAAAAT